MTRIKKEGQAKLFQNPLIEVFTKTNPLVHVASYGGVIVYLFVLSENSLSDSLMLFGLGILIWTLSEYLLHRYLFHINIPRFQYLIHGVHHEYPRDKERLLMPPLPGLTLIFLLFCIFWLVLGSQTYSFMSGFVLGYMFYSFIHYIIHTRKPVKRLKFLWTYHHKHHSEAFQDKAFGVSSPIWDYIFGTLPPRSHRVSGN